MADCSLRGLPGFLTRTKILSVWVHFEDLWPRIHGSLMTVVSILGNLQKLGIHHAYFMPLIIGISRRLWFSPQQQPQNPHSCQCRLWLSFPRLGLVTVAERRCLMRSVQFKRSRYRYSAVLSIDCRYVCTCCGSSYPSQVV